MNTIRLLFTALAGVALAGSLPAAPADASPRVDVNFINPENFTDAKDAYTPSDSGQKAILEELKDHIVRKVSSRLAKGQHLTIDVTDVDLAGDFEPWHGPNAQDVRIVKDIYTPRMNLSFKLTDAAGAVVKQGERKLRDLNFMMNISSAGRNDPYFYDKAMLDDWIGDEFQRPKK